MTTAVRVPVLGAIVTDPSLAAPVLASSLIVNSPFPVASAFSRVIQVSAVDAVQAKLSGAFTFTIFSAAFASKESSLSASSTVMPSSLGVSPSGSRITSPPSTSVQSSIVPVGEANTDPSVLNSTL